MRRMSGLMLYCVFVVAACAERGSEETSHDEGSSVVQVAATTMSAATVETGDTISVWKDPNCGCCKNWVEHMRKHGFTVVVHDTPDLTPVKQSHGVGADLASCHTGVVRGYVIEGHVPADLVRRMIAEKPPITGLAVPGMPMGSPGMEGGTAEKYDVIAFSKDGGRSVYASR